MNQNKKKTTSKKTSLFQPTYSSVSTIPKDNLRIAEPLSDDCLPTKEEENIKEKLKNDDFQLEKYYENLNKFNQFNLNNDNELNNEISNQNNQLDSSQFINQNNTQQQNIDTSQQNILNQQLTDQMDNKKSNYSSYFGINKLTNYFNYNRSSDNQNSKEENLDHSNLNQHSNLSNNNLQQFNQSFFNNDNLNSDFYHSPKSHWFYKLPLNKKSKDSNNDKNLYEEQLEQNENWYPFAFHDSEALEKAFLTLDSNPNVIVSTNGNRYDCFVKDRYRKSIYWSEENQPIRRCTWYFKQENMVKFQPYTEEFAYKLEQIYYDVLLNNKWNQRIELNSSSQEMIIFYSYNSIIHYELLEPGVFKDEWNTVNENSVKPSIVSRELTIEELQNYDVCLNEDESYHVDHLVFLVHGVGAICDFRLRSIKEVVDDFRKISLELTRTHFRSNQNVDQNLIGKVEFLPIFWHDGLHGNQTNIDERLKLITLPSVSKLRDFLNDSVLDSLFYTSPVYHQHIVNVVTNEINRLYDLFIARNPYFKGTVSLSGHSLGSVILFDLLANQNKLNNLDDNLNASQNKKLTDEIVYNSKTVNYGQENIVYPKFKFNTDCFFALGSPISMFLTLRGITKIDENFSLPNCEQVFNIFHPLDPIAYRMEPLINKEYNNLPPVTIPHHKGRKRMHLEIKENLVKMGSDIKEKFIKSIWNSVNNFVGMPRSNSNLSELNEQLNQQQVSNDQEDNDMYDFPTANNPNSQLIKQQQIKVNLNKGRRIDYMLQEKPIEFFNQYIFALATHACYWSNQDTILFVLKELYKLKQIYTVKDLEENELNNQLNQEMSNSSTTVASTSKTSDNIQNNFNIQSNQSNYQSTNVNVE